MEVTNLLHVMLQIWLINWFLNGQFISLGGHILSFSDWNQIVDPLETVFPKVRLPSVIMIHCQFLPSSLAVGHLAVRSFRIILLVDKNG